jgi:ribosomal protein S18 acetylase RimI-like enzyme
MPQPTEPLIRSFQEKDTAAVIALWNEVLPDSAPHNDPGQAIRRKLDVDRDLFYVAIVDSALVGTVMGGYDGHRGWVYSLAVAPEHQRRGIASALIAHLEAALVARGCLKINLQVRTSNEGVVEFYRQCGYQVEDRISLGKRMYDEHAGE